MSVDSIKATATPPAAPTFDMSFMASEEFLRDPFTPLRQLREYAPVYRNDQGHWLLTRHRDCRAGFGDARLKNLSFRRCYPDAAEDGSVVHSVDPENTSYVAMRKMVVKQFTPDAMRRLHPRIQRIVDDLVDTATDAGDIDLVNDFSYPLAIQVACDYFGVPASDRVMFKGWVDDFVAFGDVLDGQDEDLDRRRMAAINKLVAYLGTLIPHNRRRPSDDLFGALVTALDAVDPELTDRELPEAVAALLISGYEATANFLSGATHILLNRPDELRQFRDDPSIGTSAINELMRYWTPTAYIVRMARTDFELDGQPIAKGDPVAFVMVAANRDPEVFEDPDRLNLTRHPNPHISFGHGPHACIGAVLTETEARIGLGSLLRRAPDLVLRSEPSFKKNFVMRGFSSMPVSMR